MKGTQTRWTSYKWKLRYSDDTSTYPATADSQQTIAITVPEQPEQLVISEEAPIFQRGGQVFQKGGQAFRRVVKVSERWSGSQKGGWAFRKGRQDILEVWSSFQKRVKVFRRVVKMF